MMSRGGRRTHHVLRDRRASKLLTLRFKGRQNVVAQELSAFQRIVTDLSSVVRPV